jgi:hypothetical protein
MTLPAIDGGPASCPLDAERPRAHASVGACDLGPANTDFIQMQEEIGGVCVHAVRTCLLKFFTAIAARKQADPEGAGPSSGEQVPDAVADDDGRADVGTNTRCGGEEQVRVWAWRTGLGPA